MRFKPYFIAFCLTLCVWPGSACAAPDIKIGASITLSGKLAFYGDAAKQGLTLGVEKVNAEGGIAGRKLQLIIEDNAGEPKSAISSVKKLFDVDHVDILFTGFSHISQAVKQEAKRVGKIMFYHASVGSIAEESELFFHDWSDTSTQALAMYQALKHTGYKRIAVLQEHSDVCESFMTRLRELLTTDKITIVKDESYDPGESDFKPILLRVRASNPDVIAMCAWRDEATLMPQLNQVGMLNIPTVHHFAPFLPASDTPEMRKLFEENKAVSVWLGFAEGSLNQQQQEFFATVNQRFGNTPRIEAAMAYDDIAVLAAAMRRCITPNDEKPSSQCIAKELQKTNYDGAAGKLEFDSAGRANRPDIIIRVRNGRWESFLPGNPRSSQDQK